VRDEIDESLGEDLRKLFEAADDADLTTRKSSLVDALKACGVSGDVKDDPEGFCLAFEDGDEYRAACGCLAEPETFHKLAELGWVVAKGGDRAMSGEPADYGISFLEITTVVTGDSDKAPNAEKVRKDSRKDATAEQDRDDELNPVEDKDYTSDDNQKGMGDAKDGADPEGKPKGSKSESVHPLAAHFDGPAGEGLPRANKRGRNVYDAAKSIADSMLGKDSESAILRSVAKRAGLDPLDAALHNVGDKACPECGSMAYLNPQGDTANDYQCSGCGYSWVGELLSGETGYPLDKGRVQEGGHKAGCTCGFCKNKGKGFGKKKKDGEAEGADDGVADKDTGHDKPEGGDTGDTTGIGKQADGEMPEGAEAIVANMLEDFGHAVPEGGSPEDTAGIGAQAGGGAPDTSTLELSTPEQIQQAEQRFHVCLSPWKRAYPQGRIIQLPTSLAGIVDGRVLQHRGEANSQPSEEDAALLQQFLSRGHAVPEGGSPEDTAGIGVQRVGEAKKKAVKGKVVAKAPGKVVREDCGVAKCKKSPKAKPVAKAPGKVVREGQGLARDPEYVKLANAVRFALKGHPSAQPLDAARKALAQYCAQRGINVRQDPELVELLYENDLPEPPRVDEMTTCGDIPSLESPMAFNGGPRTKPDAKERLRRLKMRRDPEGTEGQK